MLGWQWGGITAVCLGALLLLLALLGTASARLQNRFSLSGFAVLEGFVAFGMFLSGAWCLALATGSAPLSDLTWQAMNKEVGRLEYRDGSYVEAGRNEGGITGKFAPNFLAGCEVLCS